MQADSGNKWAGFFKSTCFFRKAETAGFCFALSELLPRSDDQLISLDPELRAGAVEIAFGEEGVEQRFRSGPRA